MWRPNWLPSWMSVDICDPPEIAGPGFINFRLKTDRLAAETAQGWLKTIGLALSRSFRHREYISSITRRPTSLGQCMSVIRAAR